jgi:hypothetical protein
MFHAAIFSCCYHLSRVVSAALMDFAIGRSGLMAAGEMTAILVRSERLESLV